MNLLLRPLEALKVATAPARLRWPPLFVVGAPRTGTTLVGLHLSNSLRFAGFCNAAKFNPRTPYLSTREALRASTSLTSSASYDNDYGRAEGPLATSDGWHILARFFPSRHTEAGPGDVRHPRRLVALMGLIEGLFGAPFMLKNNANSMRVKALADLFPDALFVQVRRALPEAATSLLRARQKHGTQLGDWWSAAPPQFRQRGEWNGELEQVVATLWGLEQYVAEELEQLAPGRWLPVDYDEFCAAPGDLLAWVEARYAERGVTLETLPREHPSSFEASRMAEPARSELAARIAPILERLKRLQA